MSDKSTYAELLSSYSQSITDLYYIEEEINSAIKGAMVDSNASKELRKIRRHIDICEGKIREKLDKFLKSSNNKDYIQEFFISKRNGRYTIPIKANYKNQVEGNIIEMSSKGTTAFIEPITIAKYTSELEGLKVEETIEVYRILSILSEKVFDKLREIRLNIEVISEYDMIFAKAKYSYDINGISPKLNNKGHIKIVNGKYPMIKNSIPLNFEIGDLYRGLIITGPNAGGRQQLK